VNDTFRNQSDNYAEIYNWKTENFESSKIKARGVISHTTQRESHRL